MEVRKDGLRVASRKKGCKLLYSSQNNASTCLWVALYAKQEGRAPHAHMPLLV